MNWPLIEMIEEQRQEDAMSDKCACVSADALTCSQIRYGIDQDEDFIKQPCECPCHEVEGEDEVVEWIKEQP